MGEEAEACPITKGPSLRVTSTGCPTVLTSGTPQLLVYASGGISAAFALVGAGFIGSLARGSAGGALGGQDAFSSSAQRRLPG